MNDLVKTKNGVFYTDTRIIADMLKTGDKKRDSDIHRDVLKTVNKQIIDGYSSVSKSNDRVATRSLQNETDSYICSITNATFTKSEYFYGDKGNKADMYILNEEAFHLIITHLTKYGRARELNLQFIKAFKLLRQHLTNTKDLQLVTEHELLKELVPHDAHGTVSEVNELPRTKKVRSYYRSKNGKEMDENLINELEMIQYDLFGGHETIPYKTKGITYK